jgi:hypothetical protein
MGAGGRGIGRRTTTAPVVAWRVEEALAALLIHRRELPQVCEVGSLSLVK